MTDLLALYRGARREAFRLETQQQYEVPAESAQYEAFLLGLPIPPDPAVEQSMQIIRDATARGVRLYRAHVVDLPLTDYLRYEMAAYEENTAAGEEVFIAVRTPRLAVALTGDFVLFDSGTPQQSVVHMHYDAEGHLAGTHHTSDSAFVDTAIRLRDAALAHAVPLRDFTALAEAG
jgi:hypothetical protein